MRFSTHPAEESFRQWEAERKQERNRYWVMLRKAKNDWLKLTEQAALEYDLDDGAFYYYLQQNYGLRIELIDGKIGPEYAVVDEQKYLLFILKYGSHR